MSGIPGLQKQPCLRRYDAAGIQEHFLLYAGRMFFLI